MGDDADGGPSTIKLAVLNSKLTRANTKQMDATNKNAKINLMASIKMLYVIPMGFNSL